MSGPARFARMPWKPVEDYLAVNHPHDHPNMAHNIDRPILHMARVLGVSAQSIHRYRRDGIPWHSADRIASAINLHPMELWPDEWRALDCELV